MRLGKLLKIERGVVRPRHDWAVATEYIFGGVKPTFTYDEYLKIARGLPYKPSALECADIRRRAVQR